MPVGQCAVAFAGRFARSSVQPGASRDVRPRHMQYLAYERQAIYNGDMNAQTLGLAVQAEDRPVLDELVAYFGDGNRSAYLRATLKVMRSIMIASQLRESQAYGQQRTAELGIEPTDVPALVQEFLKGSRREEEK